MKDTLLKIAEYIEQQSARVEVLERKIEVAEKANAELVAEIALLRSRLEELENRPVAEPVDEPEVEVELILADDEDTPEETPAAEPEPVVEPAPEPEPVAEEPVAEPEPAPVAEEPAPAAEPEKAKGPVQTSLFGAAVTDIRHAISLGDRFLFQRELFGGNGEAMQKALNDINECDDMAAAMNYINKLGWNRESSTYELFVNVLRRRFN